MEFGVPRPTAVASVLVKIGRRRVSVQAAYWPLFRPSEGLGFAPGEAQLAISLRHKPIVRLLLLTRRKYPCQTVDIDTWHSVRVIERRTFVCPFWMNKAVPQISPRGAGEAEAAG